MTSHCWKDTGNPSLPLISLAKMEKRNWIESTKSLVWPLTNRIKLIIWTSSGVLAVLQRMLSYSTLLNQIQNTLAIGSSVVTSSSMASQETSPCSRVSRTHNGFQTRTTLSLSTTTAGSCSYLSGGDYADCFSGIYGFKVPCLISTDPTKSSQLKVVDSMRHIIYTAETHNFPTGVCPFPGAVSSNNNSTVYSNHITLILIDF